MRKEEFEMFKPEMKIEKFEMMDVITTSGDLCPSDLGTGGVCPIDD